MVNSSRDLTPQAITWDEIEKIKKKTKIGSKVTWKVLTGLVDNTMARYPTIAKRLVLTGKYQFVATAVDQKTGITYSMRWTEIALWKREKR